MSIPLTGVEEKIIGDLQAGASLQLTLAPAVGLAEIIINDSQKYDIGETEVSNLESVNLITVTSEDENQGFRRLTYGLTDAGKIWPNDPPVEPPVISIPTSSKINVPALVAALLVLAALIFVFIRFFA